LVIGNDWKQLRGFPKSGRQPSTGPESGHEPEANLGGPGPEAASAALRVRKWTDAAHAQFWTSTSFETLSRAI
jgi:hypothetical protein